MVTHNEARAALQQVFVDNISTTPYLLDGQEGDTQSESLWVRLTVSFGDGEQASLGESGNRLFRYDGYVFAEVYTKKNVEGAIYNNDIKCAQIKNWYEGQDITNVQIWEVSVRTVGEEDVWFQQNVVIHFSFDEIR